MQILQDGVWQSILQNQPFHLLDLAWKDLRAYSLEQWQGSQLLLPCQPASCHVISYCKQSCNQPFVRFDSKIPHENPTISEFSEDVWPERASIEKNSKNASDACGREKGHGMYRSWGVIQPMHNQTDANHNTMEYRVSKKQNWMHFASSVIFCVNSRLLCEASECLVQDQLSLVKQNQMHFASSVRFCVNSNIVFINLQNL